MVAALDDQFRYSHIAQRSKDVVADNRVDERAEFGGSDGDEATH